MPEGSRQLGQTSCSCTSIAFGARKDPRDYPRAFLLGQSELSLSAVHSLVAIETMGIYRHHTVPLAESTGKQQCQGPKTCQGPQTCPSSQGGTGLSPGLCWASHESGLGTAAAPVGIHQPGFGSLWRGMGSSPSWS